MYRGKEHPLKRLERQQIDKKYAKKSKKRANQKAGPILLLSGVILKYL
jgi:hypothetical protein